MHLKDYYQLLQVPPTATLPEIKKAYRSLAKQYHPDTNQQDPYAAARFADIKEAYEVLVSPVKKEHYLQQRWFNQSMGRKKTQPVFTPFTVLKEFLELEKYVSTLDVFRMDRQGLFEYLDQLLEKGRLEKLTDFNEQDTLDQVIQVAWKASKPIKPQQALHILERLEILSGPVSAPWIQQHRQTLRKKHRRKHYNLLFVLLATLILCLLIWLGANDF